MTLRRRHAVIAALAILMSLSSTVASRDLTFEERVEAQRAIERVYHSHLEGSRRTFEQAVSQELLERKVRTYLRQSSVLAERWGMPITGEALAAEANRIARSTMFPERLVEIESALGQDTFLIQETLVRAALAERLTRNFYAYDHALHAEARREVQTIQRQIERRTLDPRQSHARRTVQDVEEPVAAAGGRLGRRLMRTGQGPKIQAAPTPPRVQVPADRLGVIHEDAGSFSLAVELPFTDGTRRAAIYTVSKIPFETWWGRRQARLSETSVSAAAGSWPGFAASRRAAGLSECPEDGWDNGVLDDVPDPRYGHSAVWTGTEMIVWGGSSARKFPANAGRYDPLTDTWRGISLQGAPFQLPQSTAIWTGTEMIIWGGARYSGRYDPAADTWSSISPHGRPDYQYAHSAVWTGSEMIVWGGEVARAGPTAAGARYDPSTDTWRPLPLAGAPSRRTDHTAIWTGTEMIVWGGRLESSEDFYDYPTTGARYNPATDFWTALPDAGAPQGRFEHVAVWSGHEMIVWGGQTDTCPWEHCQVILGSGGRFDPVSNAWSEVSTLQAPSPRRAHVGVWTGTHLIIAGGSASTRFHSSGPLSGGQYDPRSDTWVSIPLSDPVAIIHGTAVWTGSLMITWGGAYEPGSGWSPVWLGGRYDPEHGIWTPISRSPAGGIAPPAETRAVWTGTEMIVWSHGGGRYDPVLDTWRGMPTEGAPEARTRHVAIWTGDEMVVWGGFNGAMDGVYFDTGGRYDPVAGTWRPTSTANAPDARVESRAVWTGREMMVWGGYRVTKSLASMGGRYDPESDRWATMSQYPNEAPEKSHGHSVVWTGREMIVWGGSGGLTSGGRYDPARDSWEPMPGEPGAAKGGHAAVWTGRQMIIAGGDSSFDPHHWAYDRASDSWTQLPDPDETARKFPAAIWTGRQMLLWGAYELQFDAGLAYDRMVNEWTPLLPSGAPVSRGFHDAVWTGKAMLVWGGAEGSIGLNPYNWLSSGGRYVFHQGIDDDGDGFSECEGDCDDTDGLAYPGAVESCNGRDDSCDGEVDEDAAGRDSDGDGIANSCDACPLFSTPGRDDPFFCATAEQDGGLCLGTRIELATTLPHGEVTLLRQTEIRPDSILFEINAMSCIRSDPLDLLLNGEEIARFIDPAATCDCREYTHQIRVSDAGLLARLWRAGGTNEIGIRMIRPVGFPGTFIGFIKATLESTAAGRAPSVCLFDAWGGSCHQPNLCIGGGHYLSLDETIPLQLTLTREDVLSRTEFSGSSFPRLIELTGIEDGPLQMCVGPSGPHRLYAAAPGGGFYNLDTSSGVASSVGTLPIDSREVAHDEVSRQTWSHVAPPAAPSMVQVDLNTLTSDDVSPFLSRESAGLEFLNGRLYSVESATGDPRLLEIQPEAGSSRVAAALPQGAWAGLAYEPASDLFLSAHLDEGKPGLWSIDAVTGEAELRYPLTFMPTDIEFGPDGALYAAVDAGSDTGLHRIDTATGATTLVGLMGVPGVTSLATVRNLPRGCMDIVKQGEEALAINGLCASPPTAVAGADVVFECSSQAGAVVRLDGTGSTDADNDIASYEWLVQVGTPDETLLGTGSVLETVLPLGEHTVTLRVLDGAGQASLDQVAVRVSDTQAPVLSLTADPAILWPPSHQMVPVTVGIAVQDVCDAAPAAALESITSSEAAGEAGGDIQPAGPTVILLRAERSGSEGGRVYTIVYRAADGSGNASTASTTIAVPHDQRRIRSAPDM